MSAKITRTGGETIVDVRDDLREGREPFADIMKALHETPRDHALVLLATFRPEPFDRAPRRSRVCKRGGGASPVGSGASPSGGMKTALRRARRLSPSPAASAWGRTMPVHVTVVQFALATPQTLLRWASR